MPQHQANKERIERAINARGAIVIWNPPNSPDLNPIEVCPSSSYRSYLQY
jgi:hypothetical protein